MARDDIDTSNFSDTLSYPGQSTVVLKITVCLIAKKVEIFRLAVQYKWQHVSVRLQQKVSKVVWCHNGATRIEVNRVLLSKIVRVFACRWSHTSFTAAASVLLSDWEHGRSYHKPILLLGLMLSLVHLITASCLCNKWMQILVTCNTSPSQQLQCACYLAQDSPSRRSYIAELRRYSIHAHWRWIHY